MWKRLTITTLAFGLYTGAAPAPINREPLWAGVRLYYGPGVGLTSLDVDLIGRAAKSIDLTAYVLKDRDVIVALTSAASRGAKVRVYLDPEQNSSREARPDGKLAALLRAPGVEARVKAAAGDPMHLKSYQVDGRYLRTGSANFSFSGEERQDNDIVIIESREAAGAFLARFEEMWSRKSNLRLAP